jgi:hypothetical protein
MPDLFGYDPPPSKPYRPSNGTEGMEFIEHWCGRCKRDQAYQESDGEEDGCPIVAASLAFDVDAPDYPREWVQDDPWGNPRCTAFAPI